LSKRPPAAAPSGRAVEALRHSVCGRLPI